MPKERILIVDDEKNIVSSLTGILSDEGYEVSITGDGIEALEIIQTDPPDLVLLDIWLPGMDGIEVLKTVKAYHPEIEVLIMSGHGTIETAVKATKLGAQDFIEKPFSLERIIQSIEEVLRNKHASSRSEDRPISLSKELPLCFESMVEVKKSVKAFSKNMKPVLLTGESGTGKEFIAQAIHRQSRKNDRAFVKINCSFRQARSIHSLLFKRSEKANSSRQMREEKVIYLSNIESLSKGLQEKLTEALRPNGSQSTDTPLELIPIRVFASSTKDLKSLAAKGQFHPALLEAFNDSTLFIPPLRDYTGSIPELANDYLEEIRKTQNTSVSEIGKDALAALCRYTWPGNVKELRSVLSKSILTGVNQQTISAQDLPAEIWQPQVEVKDIEGTESIVEAELVWEKHFILHHLKQNNWDVEATCKALKTEKKQLKEKIARHAIELPSTSNTKNGTRHPQRTLKRSVVLCGSGLHSGIKTGLILQPLPPGSGIIFGDISTGKTIPAHLENVQSTDYATRLQKDRASVGTIEHIMAVLHMYKITNLLIKIGDEAPVMDGSAKDFCDLIEDGEFEEQEDFYEEIVIDKKYTFGDEDQGGPFISIEPSDRFSVSYHMDYPEPIGIQDYTYEFTGDESFKKEIAPARTFGFMEEMAQLTKMGYASGGKLDNFILLGDKKVLNTELRFKDEFPRHKILDILGDFYLLGKPIRGHIKACKSGHTQNIGLLKHIQNSLIQKN
ncbi:MAG: UDP-3-O-[3-hydroxymyristoyl] N-acetylglucosamine deacetylase [Nitrospinaceae bacterium]|nr:UDP-3-O-[3-hydroxymyristoyl] N-acetylglucosamine deacetylase [Nitrospinaceae bacterium]MBT5869304.1 UDP-3-O-[3-hydroxymyristoyl] N-acetylglucosamine deacetylase [Nitrospinaceae bacterium]MBT6345636.1 UDP-3-O-[3-hydroxymyristoyl] N-acetylglucosamine deacetylase [Nitrospina sp.]